MTIFLDIVGVLKHKYMNPAGLDFPHSHLCIDCISRLNTIDAQIVLSTGHRFLDGFDDALYSAGLTVPIVGRTPDFDKNRGKEIESYVTDFKVGNYAILDDNTNTLLPHQLPRLVKTHISEGITDQTITTLLQILSPS